MSHRPHVLSDHIIKNFSVAKRFDDENTFVNSGVFSRDGGYFVTGTDNGAIHVYNCTTGTKHDSIMCKKYGVENLVYSVNQDNVIHSSNKINDTIRLLSLKENRYLRYFEGHTKRVISMDSAKTQDLFISTSLDETLKLWDTRSPTLSGNISISGTMLACIDPKGSVMCTANNTNLVNYNLQHSQLPTDYDLYIKRYGELDEYKADETQDAPLYKNRVSTRLLGSADHSTLQLYDLRHYHRGPFLKFTDIVQNTSSQMSEFATHLVFSPDGKYILVSTNMCHVYLVNSFSGLKTATYDQHENPLANYRLRASFSPDGEYVFIGSADKHIYVYRSLNSELVTRLPTPNLREANLTFNSSLMMAAVTERVTEFWVPSE